MLKRDTLALDCGPRPPHRPGTPRDGHVPALAPGDGRGISRAGRRGAADLSAFLFGFAVGQFVYGPLSDRLGRRPVLLFGLGAVRRWRASPARSRPRSRPCPARFVQALGAAADRACPRHGARSLFGPPAGRELSRMGMIMGVVPARPRPRRRSCTSLRLAGELRRPHRCRRSLSRPWCCSGLPETSRPARRRRSRSVRILRGFRTCSATGLPGLRAIVVPRLWRPVRLHLRLVLRAAGGLRPVEIAFAVAFAFVVIGFMAARSWRSARRAPRHRPHDRLGVVLPRAGRGRDACLVAARRRLVARR